mmetsp:Transcript_766/g.1797  ORF Transcript_766/g.1797 Transcript_766/m.1797 type:complete len:228 (-) Transcript_766:1675-2358(-)
MSFGAVSTSFGASFEVSAVASEPILAATSLPESSSGAFAFDASSAASTSFGASFETSVTSELIILATTSMFVGPEDSSRSAFSSSAFSSRSSSITILPSSFSTNAVSSAAAFRSMQMSSSFPFTLPAISCGFGAEGDFSSKTSAWLSCSSIAITSVVDSFPLSSAFSSWSSIIAVMLSSSFLPVVPVDASSVVSCSITEVASSFTADSSTILSGFGAEEEGFSKSTL